jgi:16S rRNA processing protein RimM
MSDLIVLGHVARAFGIEGGVVVKLINQNSLSLEAGKLLVLKTLSGQDMVVTVKTIMHGGRVFFNEISSRTQAETFKGAEIWLSRSLFPPLADDEFYLGDLLHARVVDVTGCVLGQVVGFSSNGAQDLLEVKTNSGNYALIPAIRPIVQQIDLGTKIITIDPPLGLLDATD